MSTRLRIIVLGYIIRGPIGGLVWHHLQYFLGLRDLGHDVYFIEDSDDYPACYDPSRDTVGVDPSYGLAIAAELFLAYGLEQRWAYFDAHRHTWLGPCAGDAESLCRSADLVLNLSGMNPIRPWLVDIPVRCLVDTDPVFTQVKHLTDHAALQAAQLHTSFFTFGENLPAGTARIPSDGLPWQATRQPIVLGCWEPTPGPLDGALTTVMQWDSYARREYGGCVYGMKSDSFTPYLDLPQRSGARFELAMGGPDQARELLESHGWHSRNPLLMIPDPWSYRDFISRSMAEFSVAKQGYWVSESGWFSERSAAYLASGRPVITQDTGFSQWLPTGLGLLSFNSPEEAVGAIENLKADYPRHCRSARELAEEYFDASAVLTALIERASA
jgi:hypothetical protein